MIALLLQHGANRGAKDVDGLTPAQVALAHGQKAAAALIDPNAQLPSTASGDAVFSVAGTLWDPASRKQATPSRLLNFNYDHSSAKNVSPASKTSRARLSGDSAARCRPWIAIASR